MLILLADDHLVVRRGLRGILANEFHDAQFFEAGTGDEVLRAVRSRPCNLLVLDVNMPGRSGVDVLREVKSMCPQLPVLMLSVQPEDQYAVRCLARRIGISEQGECRGRTGQGCTQTLIRWAIYQRTTG